MFSSRNCGLVVAGLALVALAAPGAHAQALTPIAGGTGFGTAANVFYDGTQLTVSQPAQYRFSSDINPGQVDLNANITLGPLTDTTGPGAYTFNPITGAFVQMLDGGSFTVTDAANPADVLLKGTFGASQLTGQNGGPSGGVNLVAQSVTYTGGDYLPAGYLTTGGSLSLEFTAVNTTGGGSGFTAGPGGVSAFSAHDGITFSAQPAAVPEPSSAASLSLGVLGLGALAFTARRRRAA